MLGRRWLVASAIAQLAEPLDRATADNLST